MSKQQETSAATLSSTAAAELSSEWSV